MSLQVTLGTDPEVFLTLGGKYISAAGLFPGTKEEPHPVDKGAVQVDGVALEFNIHPAKTPEEFSNNIETVLTQMKEMVAKVDKDMKIQFSPIANFDRMTWDKIPEQAKVLGCDPDFSSIDGKVISKQNITNHPFRTAAGHVHVGWTENEDSMSPAHFEDARFIAEQFYKDKTFPFKAKLYSELTRLRYYGNYGAFRPKPYGVELREFSNLWVKEPKHREKMFGAVARKITNLYKG